jgi:hypothetical protein
LKGVDRVPVAFVALSLACAPQVATPTLITPQQAQDRVYDHLSRAEAAQMFGSARWATAEREKARRYKRLIRDGKTTTPEQALALAAIHEQRAEAYERDGYTRYTPAELHRAATYEEFAIREGGVTALDASGIVSVHRVRADEYARCGLPRLAQYHRARAQRLIAVARTEPRRAAAQPN